MKALLILADNVYLTPYLKFYSSILDEMGICYNVLYWDKNNNEIIEDNKFIRFGFESTSKLEKIPGYVKFRQFIINEVRKDKYDVIIPLHSILFIILFDLLVNKYRNRFIFDIRDYSYEKFWFFRKIEEKLTEKSIINIVSSKGYINFLPDAEYYVVHNIPRMQYEEYKQKTNSDSSVITLSFIGLIRFMEQNKKIIDFFCNDERFIVKFIGTNAEQLHDYCQVVGAKNISLIGSFDPSKTLEFYKDTDAILNLYGNHVPLLDYALSNKLYFAAALYKPIIVCEDTYMEEISSLYNIGFTLRMKDPAEKDELYRYIKNIDREAFIKNCDKFMDFSITENQTTRMEVSRRLSCIS